MNNLSKDYEYLLYSLNTSLFKKKFFDSNKNLNIPHILSEAKAQTVFPLVYSALGGEYDLSLYQTDYYGIVSQNVKIFEEHKKLHKLLNENNIPYVFLKGCASAQYYPDPLLRTMGDVDILVKEKDIEETVRLLLDDGYKTEDSFGGIHISFENSVNHIRVELHRQINGIPESEMGNKISALFSDIFERAVLENGEYLRPCDFHHGLILLLHTATHLTHEGIGLRHLCDWAVFVASFTDEKFSIIFKDSLKHIGLWKFAQILTNCAVKHLGCPPKEWAGTCDDTVTDEIITDIFNGGNFGKKDFSRYQQIKYISNRADKTVTSESSFKRLLSNTLQKAKTEISFVKKAPFLLPLGCVVVVFKYICLIISGKRRLDNKQLIATAKDRKELYNKLELFK